MKRNTSPQNNPQPSPWPWLLGILKPLRGRIIIAGFSVVGAAVAMLGLARSAQFLADKSLHDPSGVLLNYALLAMVASAVLMAVSSYFRATSVNILANYAEQKLRRQVFEKLLALDTSFHATHASGDMLSRLGVEIGHVQNMINLALPNGIRNGLLLVGGFVLMAMTSWELCLLTFLAVPLLSIPVVIMAPRLRNRQKEMSEAVAGMHAFLSERLTAVRTTQLFAAEAQQIAELDRLHSGTDSAHRSVYKMRGLLVSIIIVIVFMVIGFILWSGGRMVLAGTMTQGEIAAFVMYSVIAAGALATLMDLGSSLTQARVALERLREIIDTPVTITAPATPVKTPTSVPTIIFENVSFAYPATETRILHGVSFTVKPRETVALVGPSGAGKSTVFALLTRLYDPQEGRITLDGTDIREFDPRDLRALFGVIPQEPDIFAMTLTDNIAFGANGLERNVIEHAAKQANAAEYIDRLPAHYDTLLGERGVGLSVGQKQRLAIARALVRDPKILLMDEATSALDAESERLVQAALIDAAQGRTALIVAHRLATIRSADRILVFDKGALLAQGTHDELIAQNGLYAHLASLQFLA